MGNYDPEGGSRGGNRSPENAHRGAAHSGGGRYDRNAARSGGSRSAGREYGGRSTARSAGSGNAGRGYDGRSTARSGGGGNAGREYGGWDAARSGGSRSAGREYGGRDAARSAGSGNVRREYDGRERTGGGGSRAGGHDRPSAKGRYSPGRKRGSRTDRREYFPIVFIMVLAAVLIATVYGACSACRSCSCGGRDDTEDSGSPYTAGTPVSGTDGGSTAPEEIIPEPEPDPVALKAEELLAGMSDGQKIGSLLLVRGDKLVQSEFEQLIVDVHAAGAVLFKTDFEDKDREGVIDFTSALQSAGGGHMLLCVDEEGGDVVRISSNSLLRENRFRSPRRLYNNGGFENIAADTLEKCGFLKGFGINVNFAPVADVVTDEDGFLYKRAFGGDAQSTAEYVRTVVGVMREQGMGSSIKHFPGYGNAHGDTHQGLVESAVTADSLRSSDLVPFISGIEAGADSVMITHTIVSCIDPERPCSLSPAAVSLLRDELGFDGVIITDGLDMGAIKKFCGDTDPCVRAFLAGCDLMCTPEDPRASYSELLTALESGEITRERLDESVKRVLMWKIRLGLYDN